MPFMYILKCNDDSLYIGSTWNLDKRINEHLNGIGCQYTKNKLPIELVYYEEFDRIDEAFKREHQIKGWSKQKKLSLINGNIDKLPELSKKEFH